MRRNTMTALVFGILLFTLLVVGCGRGHHKLSGRVTYSDDNTPLERGQVCFVNDKGMARAKIQDDGQYTVGSFTEQDGLPPGTYKVYITGAEREEPGQTPTSRPTYIPLIEPKFSTAAMTEMSFVVDGSQKTFDFTVDRASVATINKAKANARR